LLSIAKEHPGRFDQLRTKNTIASASISDPLAEIEIGSQLAPYTLESVIALGLCVHFVWPALAVVASGCDQSDPEGGLTNPCTQQRLDREISFLKSLDHLFMAQIFQIENDCMIYPFMTHVTFSSTSTPGLPARLVRPSHFRSLSPWSNISTGT
jgi:hypothetical protein